MVLLFCSLPIYIGDHLDSYPLGFLVVGIYLLATGLLFW
jgi:hypothetical protein